MATPFMDVLKRLATPLGCGWKGCEDVVFGRQPIPHTDDPRPMQAWEAKLTFHDNMEGHRHRKLKECL